MPAFLLQYDKDRCLLRDVIEFPDGAETAAEWNKLRYAEALGEPFQVEVIYAGGRDAIADLHFCIRHAVENPVPFREATAEEMGVDSLEKVQALRFDA